MSESSLHVSGLTAGYIPGMPIISDVEIRVEPCEIVSIIGPNGAGKSTLLKAIAGLIHIESGKVFHGGRDISRIRTDRLTQSGIALVPQIENIFRTMTVEQNLVVSAKRCKQARQQRCNAMLDQFPLLRDKYKAKAGSLSGGQRQFLALAMALVASPSLLLLDEPSAGLSPRAAQEVLGILQDIAGGGVAILMVEQNAKAALRLSHRAYVMAEGRNQHDGNAQALLNDPVLGQIYLGARRRNGHVTEPL